MRKLTTLHNISKLHSQTKTQDKFQNHIEPDHSIENIEIDGCAPKNTTIQFLLNFSSNLRIKTSEHIGNVRFYLS